MVSFRKKLTESDLNKFIIMGKMYQTLFTPAERVPIDRGGSHEIEFYDEESRVSYGMKVSRSRSNENGAVKLMQTRIMGTAWERFVHNRGLAKDSILSFRREFPGNRGRFMVSIYIPAVGQPVVTGLIEDPVGPPPLALEGLINDGVVEEAQGGVNLELSLAMPNAAIAVVPAVVQNEEAPDRNVAADAVLQIENDAPVVHDNAADQIPNVAADAVLQIENDAPVVHDNAADQIPNVAADAVLQFENVAPVVHDNAADQIPGPARAMALATVTEMLASVRHSLEGQLVPDQVQILLGVLENPRFL